MDAFVEGGEGKGQYLITLVGTGSLGGEQLLMLVSYSQELIIIKRR